MYSTQEVLKVLRVEMEESTRQRQGLAVEITEYKSNGSVNQRRSSKSLNQYIYIIQM